MPSLSHQTNCTPTKSSLYLTNSLTTVISAPDLYRLLTFHVPNLIPIFHCLGRTEGSVWFRGFLRYFVTWKILKRRGVVSISSNPQAGGPPLFGCSRLLFQYIRSYPPYLEAVPPSATWGRAMLLWQGPTYDGLEAMQTENYVPLDFLILWRCILLCSLNVIALQCLMIKVSDHYCVFLFRVKI